MITKIYTLHTSDYIGQHKPSYLLFTLFHTSLLPYVDSLQLNVIEAELSQFHTLGHKRGILGVFCVHHNIVQSRLCSEVVG